MNANKFAAFISFLTAKSGNTFDDYQCESVAHYVDALVEHQKVNASDVDALLAAMGKEGQKIEAIKAYRTLTGVGLKESKDAVEKYWYGVNRSHELKDILGR